MKCSNCEKSDNINALKMADYQVLHEFSRKNDAFLETNEAQIRFVEIWQKYQCSKQTYKILQFFFSTFHY